MDSFNNYANCPKCNKYVKCEYISVTTIIKTWETVAKWKCINGHRFSTRHSSLHPDSPITKKVDE